MYITCKYSITIIITINYCQIIDGCGSSSIDLFEHLYPIIMMGVSDKEDDVISNSVYGLGVLISNGVPKTIPLVQSLGVNPPSLST